MQFKNINKILVVKLRNIGDVLLTVPVFRALRETFPKAHISALVNSGTEEMLSGNSLIDEIIVFNRAIKKNNIFKRLKNEFSFLKTIRKKHFDMIVDLTSGDRAAVISFISGASYCLAFHPGRKGFIGKKHLYTHLGKPTDDYHTVVQNLDLVRQYGISTDNLNVDFYTSEDAKVFVKEIFIKHQIKDSDIVVHIHPVARWLFKCWKDEYMADVISWLLKNNIRVIITASPDKREMEKTKRILSLVKSEKSSVDLSGMTTMKQLGAISEASDLFFGVDSAPMHIAAAVGTPVLALFGPTDEKRWGPWHSSKHTVIKMDLKCMPCKKGSCEGIPLRDCMRAIKPLDVIKAIKCKINHVFKD
ncbi:MAG: putative lipopolysaccharide heptosyltransferase III [Nitrospiraceae bacterium]|nr:putative lipopolysaccharide heptosyltransferase III [Nitrospiraceae bacterium]